MARCSASGEYCNSEITQHTSSPIGQHWGQKLGISSPYQPTHSLGWGGTVVPMAWEMTTYRMLCTGSSKTLWQMLIKLGIYVSHAMRIQKRSQGSTGDPEVPPTDRATETIVSPHIWSRGDRSGDGPLAEAVRVCLASGLEHT